MALEVAYAEEDHVVLESPMFQAVVPAIPKSIAASIAIVIPPIRRPDTLVSNCAGTSALIEPTVTMRFAVCNPRVGAEPI